MIRSFIAGLFIILVTLTGCADRNILSDKDVIAQVGDNRLYLSDVSTLFTNDMLPADSLRILENYIDVWVKKQLKVAEAEKLFGSAGSEIDRMVEEYRNSLLSHKLEQKFIDENLDTLVSISEVEEYYNRNKTDFILDRPIVRGRIIKLPADHRQKSLVRDLFPTAGEKFQDLQDLSLKNNFELFDLDEWIDLAEFMNYLPSGKITDPESLLANRGVIELKDGDDSYFLFVTSFRNSGDINPVDRVRGSIERVLLTQRKQDLIRNYEDSIYKSALNGNKIEIKLN